MHKKIIAAAVAAGFGLAGSAFAADNSVEVLHWWTSGGEAAALNVLKQNLEKQGVKWNDMPVAGGGGEQAMTALRARVTAGNPPTAVQMLGFDIIDWGKQGVVGRPERGGRQGGLGQGGAGRAAEVLQVQRQVDRRAGQRALDQLGVGQQGGAGEGRRDHRAQDLGRVHRRRREGAEGAASSRIAHGGQPWQDATIFDGVALSTGGIEYYRKAFIELDPKALNSPTTKKVFQRMSQVRKLVDKDFSGRDWNVASGMVISGKAGFQMMGDWAKGEFINAKKVPGKDFLCFRFPGTQGMVIVQLRPVRDVQGVGRQVRCAAADGLRRS